MKARSAALVVDLGFGDAGKGATVDALSRRLPVPPIVVRHHGGPQAAHNVWTRVEGHTFAQFGSGALVGGRTHLSRYMLVNPLTWMNEWAHLDLLVGNKLPRTTVEEETVVITPYHRALNRLREELRQKDGVAIHGTTGHGVGETMHDVLSGLPVLTVADLHSERRTQAILDDIREHKIDIARALGATFRQTNESFFEMPGYSDAIRPFVEATDTVDRGWLGEQEADLIFEGSQGVLLDQDYGFHPHTTWSNCTFDNAEVLLEDFDGPVTKIGVLRSYMTRHGAGPFPTEDETLDLPEKDNDDSGLAGKWRVGHPDLVLWRYALSVLGGVDFLSVTHLDRYHALGKYAYAYTVDGNEFAGLDPNWCDPADLEAREALTLSLFSVEPVYGALPRPDFFLEWLQVELETPVLISANGRTGDHRRWHLLPAPKNPLMISPYASRWTTNVRAPLLNG